MSVEIAPEETAHAEGAVAEPWVTVVWNDPVNLMSYVTYVFRSYFGYPQAKAEKLMLEVHEQGRSAVSTGNREQMEVDVQAMHGFGLWATLQRGDA
ncbi:MULTISPECIES: ATP-dependent Clp protease adapter ClpS [unclassified Cellulomonas]|uniref:ATP-dependent Clp protease adapter ClpS n=1 Tax=unclassified Cellulomonas TaxID=2620175 RepID=UPI00199A5C08|nr:ATP-dependent Clp protease adapter ClpS [Cellulomonas sp. ES6]MBD3779439.1 ATP-dependent Clp protease adapter ClpS [Micrococcales bacterium]WHP18375.1 ATP-dependent Clp protease adapter ClpS [Cellulomonas sp. ES6]